MGTSSVAGGGGAGGDWSRGGSLLFHRIERDGGTVGIGAAGRPAVAVMAFDNPGGLQDTQWLTTALPSLLLTGLGQTPGLDVVSSQRLDEVLKDLGQTAGTVDKSRVLEAGRRSGAGALVVGSIFRNGLELRIDAQVQDVASGRLLGAYTVQGADPFPLADDLTRRIRGSLEVSATGEAGAKGIAEITSSNPEAYRLYVEGVDAYRNRRDADAGERLKRAVQLDPGFASAYFYLAEVAQAVGDSQAMEEYRRQIRLHLDRLPERQRLQMQANDAAAAGDTSKAIELLEGLLARYPDEETAYDALGQAYVDRGDVSRYLQTTERGVKAIPTSPALHNSYGYGLLALARYPEAIREFETYARLRPHEPNPHDSLGDAYLAAGQPEVALEKFGRALELDPAFISSHHGRAWAYGMLGRYDGSLDQTRNFGDALTREGRPDTFDEDFLEAYFLSRIGRDREAHERITEGARTAERAGNDLGTVNLLMLTGLLREERGERAAALDAWALAGRQLPQLPRILSRLTLGAAGLAVLEGIAHARAGRLPPARERLEALRKGSPALPPNGVWLLPALEGEIALAAGDLAIAETAFAAAEPQVKVGFDRVALGQTIFLNMPRSLDGLARTRTARGDLRGAVDIYRKLVAPDVGSKWTTVLQPLHVLALARVLEQSGDAAGAREQYRRFLDLWKDADPGLPELAEARRKLAAK